MTARAEGQRDQFLRGLRETPALMGVLNVTPDSFSDGGQHFGLAEAVARAETMVGEGAAIIDIGGESTRPGHESVPEVEEVRRVAPVLEALAGKLDVPLSIDTSKAEVAREAIRHGAVVVNDVWGLQRDPAMADVIAESGAAVVAMHNRDAIDASLDMLDDVERSFERSLALAAQAGIPFGRILLDPGIGFGKAPAQNHACIWNLDRFRGLGAPLLLGLSRKSFIGRILGTTVDQRLIGTVAADVVALMRGANVLRVHDVAENRAALEIFRALRAAEAPCRIAAVADDGAVSIALSLGGNVGDAATSVRRAFRALGDEPGVRLSAVSRLYRTPPWGNTDQPWFVNACAVGATTLPPETLLQRIKAIEVALGRTASERWGPRVIDIDLLAYGDRVLAGPPLTLPHPELFNRAFVLVPLAEIAPRLVVAGREVGAAASALGPASGDIAPLN